MTSLSSEDEKVFDDFILNLKLNNSNNPFMDLILDRWRFGDEKKINEPKAFKEVVSEDCPVYQSEERSC